MSLYLSYRNRPALPQSLNLHRLDSAQVCQQPLECVASVRVIYMFALILMSFFVPGTRGAEMGWNQGRIKGGYWAMAPLWPARIVQLA